MKKYDFRSDTVTKPTQKMRDAMYIAEVGDDVYEDDPTVKRLEELSAKMLGKEAGLFIPSGTFGNQLALLTHTKRGDEVILGDSCHIMMHEVGAAAVIAGVQLRTVPAEDGYMNHETIKKMIREEDIHYPDTGLICVENAHSSGKVVSLDHMALIHQVAIDRCIPVHLDGARLFNAATALGVSAREVAKHADSVMFCLSKGLCAPVGSMLVGTHEFIGKARKNRKLMGGGLRQAGIIAAAGIVALEEMVDRLDEDHKNIRVLADLLSKIERVKIKNEFLDINMLFCEIEGLKDDNAFVEALADRGFIVNGPELGEYRFVTNYWTPEDAVVGLAEAIKELLS